MKTVKLMSKLLLLAIIFTLSACSSEDGADGIDGNDGANGIDGMDGADGADGADGDIGTANVIYSDWIASEFDASTAAAEKTMELDLLDETDFDFATDVVLVYGGNNIFSASYEIFQLPHLNVQNSLYGFGFFGDSSGGTITLSVVASTLDGSSAFFNFIDFYRYIIIPGGQAAPLDLDIGSKGTTTDYSKMSYEEILIEFNIPE